MKSTEGTSTAAVATPANDPRPSRPAADLIALKADVEKHTAGLRDILDTTSPEYLVQCAASMLANRDSAARYAQAEIERLRAEAKADNDRVKLAQAIEEYKEVEVREGLKIALEEAFKEGERVGYLRGLAERRRALNPSSEESR